MYFFLQVVAAFLLCFTSVRSDPPTPPLITMSKDELLAIYDCIAKANTSALCDGFATCNVKKPDQILKAYTQCRSELGDESKRSCGGDQPLYTHEISSKIFDCTVSNTKPLDDEEKTHMVEFENCIKIVGDQCKADG